MNKTQKKTDKGKKLGILIASDRFPPDYSGAGLRAQRMAERISRRYGQKFNIICSGKENFYQKKHSSNLMRIRRMKLLKDEGITFPIYAADAFLKLTGYIRKIKDEIGVIHFFSFSWMNRMIMLSNTMFFRKKTLLEITLDKDDDLASLLSKGKKNRLMRPFTKFLLRQIDGFVVLSDYGLKTCLDFGIPREKIWLRPNPCDEKIFAKIGFKEKNRIKKSLGLPDKYILLNAGIIQPRKNQLFLCKCVNQLKNKDVLLLFLGPIRNEFKSYHEELKEYISKNHLSDNIIFLGEKDNVNEYMIAADLTVFASKYEGFPNIIAESMISGLPIITLELQNIDKYMNEKNSIIIPDNENDEKDTISKFVKAINKAYGDPGLFDKKNIREQGIRYFSAKNIDAQYMAKYDALMHGQLACNKRGAIDGGRSKK